MRERALAVTCPTCGALPGVNCGANWMGTPDMHPVRIALADRTTFLR